MKTEWSRRELEAHGEPICPQLPTKWDRRCGGGGKGGGNAPQAPDYMALANKQAKNSKEVTNQQTWANRPTQNTPWGSISWNAGTAIDPATGKKMTTWTQNYQLTPEMQKALGSQMQIQQGRSDLANSMLDQMRGEFSRPFDWGSMPAAGQNVGLSRFQTLDSSPRLRSEIATENSQRVGDGPTLDSRMRALATQNRVNLDDNGALQATDDAARQRIEQGLFNRMSPMHERQLASLDAKLASQGIMPGSAAYKKAKQDLTDQHSRESYDALQTAGSEIQRNQQMALANRQQMTNEDFAGADLFNRANQQSFDQMLRSKEFGNNALQQMYGNKLSAANLNNAAINQDFNQRLSAGNFYNQSAMNQQQLDLSRLGFNNSVGQQQFDQSMRQSQYQNQLRQQAIAEQLQRRGMSLNEINALLSGQQVGMQQMPQFNAAGASQPIQYLPAGGMQYQSALDAYNAQNMGSSSMMNGMGNIFGSLLGAYASNPSAFSSMFNFSDKRLKKILGKVGKIGEFNLYRFKYLGSNAEEVGVIAQEVEKVRPDLVMRHPNGYLMVNYEGLEA